MNKKSFLSVRALTVTAMFTVVSYVLYLFGFKLPIVPSFFDNGFFRTACCHRGTFDGTGGGSFGMPAKESASPCNITYNVGG